jgi:glycosyltransferase involved in cell wall biosynthesis
MRRLATNHTLDVYTLSTANHDFCDVRDYATTHNIFEFRPRPLFRSPWGRLNQLQRMRDLGTLTKIGEQIASQINAGKYDIAFLHPCLYTYTPTFTALLEIPSLYYLHEPFGPSFVRKFDRPYLKEGGMRKKADQIDPLISLYKNRLASLRAQSVAATTRLLANSEFTRHWMQRQYQVDTPVCYYGVNTEQFRPLPESEKEGFVLSVGELSPRKGFDFLVTSLSKIPSPQRPTLHLVCNNVQDEERNYIETLADRFGVTLQIQTRLDAEQMAIEHNRARLCIYSPVAEPFGLVPLEAMACGTPVVGIAEGGVQEIIRHEQTGLLIERDAKKFGAAIQALLNNPERLAIYGQNARTYVLEQWSWERSTKVLEEHLHEVVR